MRRAAMTPRALDLLVKMRHPKARSSGEERAEGAADANRQGWRLARRLSSAGTTDFATSLVTMTVMLLRLRPALPRPREPRAHDPNGSLCGIRLFCFRRRCWPTHDRVLPATRRPSLSGYRPRRWPQLCSGRDMEGKHAKRRPPREYTCQSGDRRWLAPACPTATRREARRHIQAGQGCRASDRRHQRDHRRSAWLDADRARASAKWAKHSLAARIESVAARPTHSPALAVLPGLSKAVREELPRCRSRRRNQ